MPKKPRNKLAHYDPQLQKLAFADPHEVAILKNAESSWKGGANAQGCIREKFLMAPLVEKNPRPYENLGKKFLADPKNKAFYDKLFFEVKGPGAVTPPKPSRSLRK